jgi:hypothetical protein
MKINFEACSTRRNPAAAAHCAELQEFPDQQVSSRHHRYDKPDRYDAFHSARVERFDGKRGLIGGLIRDFVGHDPVAARPEAISPSVRVGQA